MNTPPTILVVEDDPVVTTLICDHLQRHGLHTVVAGSGAGLRRVLASQRVDLVVLDLGLPDGDGLALLPAQQAGRRIPVIVLTGRCTSEDRVQGLECGADDYITKPFEPRELIARIQSVLRRTGATGLQRGPGVAEADVVAFDGWHLHREARTLQSPEGTWLPLSLAEYRLLNTFLCRPCAVMTRDQLLDQARGRDCDQLDRSIDLLVSRLRQKLGRSPASGPSIRTVRGTGYMLSAQRIEPIQPLVRRLSQRISAPTPGSFSYSSSAASQ